MNQRGLPLCAEKEKAGGPGVVERCTVELLCRGLVEGHSGERVGSLATGAPSECHRDLERIALGMRRQGPSHGASI